MTFLEESEALHARVRALVSRRDPLPDAEFEALALELARFQARHSRGFARLVERRGGRLSRLDEIPAVPSDAFRATRVALHEPALDVARFHTSGTTGSERGEHALRTTKTYETLAIELGRRALVPGERALTVAALAPLLDEPPSSSLGFMMALFMRAFDGRAFGDATPFSARAPERWLLSADGVDMTALQHAIEVAARRGERLLLLATSFALVALLDALAGSRLPLPEGSVVMQTGGYKGRTREVPAEELRQSLARCFELPEAHFVSEYGMTELSSQLYEGTLPGAALRGARGRYIEPPWLRVTPVDAVTLEPVPGGERGLARFVDLANVDSAVAVVTRDLVRRSDDGIELLGRAPGAPPRGCSLAVEALLAG
ncbi:MAG: acyl-protein synthetase [Polyangiaceae bacterium]